MTVRPIFYDTETTGVRAENDRIVEIAAFDPLLNRTFSQLVHPGCSIPAEATAIHRITNEMVAEAPSFAKVAEEFIQFCEGDVILLAHNNDTFDFHFLRHEFARNQLILPPWRFIDTLKWSRRYRSDLPRHTLQFLREHYAIPANNAHRALDDVIVLHRVFSMMTDDLAIEEIYALLNRPRPIQHMPFGKHQGVPLKQVPRDYVLWLSTSGSLDKPENQELKKTFEQLGLLSAKK